MSLHEEVAARAQSGPHVAKVAGVIAQVQVRTSQRGNRFAFVGLSDPSGQFEVTLFSEAFEAARPHLEPGTRVVIQVEATQEGEGVRLTGRGVTPVDEGALGGAGLRVFVDRAEALDAVARLLAGTGPGKRGPVTLCFPLLGLEVEVELPEPFCVTPQVRRALKSVPGVLEVEDA